MREDEERTVARGYGRAIRKRVSLSVPLCPGKIVPLSSAGVLERRALEPDSRFNVDLAAGNTESMSVL